MSYGGAGIDPGQLQTQLALAMDLSRSVKGQEEEQDGLLRKMRFPGPPMLSGGSGQTIMGGYAGFMRPGNGVMGGVVINPPVGPEPPRPPIIGDPPEGPTGGGEGTPPFPPQGTYWSPPSFPEFSFPGTEDSFVSYVNNTDGGAGSEPSLWEIENPAGGGVNPNTDNYLIAPDANWWNLFRQWFAHQQNQNTDDDEEEEPVWEQPVDSPYCYSPLDPTPTTPEFERIPPGETPPGNFKPQRWDPREDPDPDTVYQCRASQNTACALCAWKVTETTPEIAVNVTCPGGTGGGGGPGGPGGGGNYFFDVPGNPNDGVPYWENDKLKVPIPTGCCAGPGGGKIKIEVEMTYIVECPNCNCCYYRLMDGQPQGVGGAVQEIPTACEFTVKFDPYYVNCCAGG